MLKILLTIALLHSPAAFEYRGAGGSFSMSQYPAYETLISGYNPALLSLSKSPFLQLSGEQPWSMGELGFGSLKAVVPFKNMACAVFWTNFSSNEYRENSLDVIYSISPFSWLSLGAVFNYYNLYIHDRNITTEHFFDGSVHLAIRPFKWLHLSGSVENAAACFNENNTVINGNYYFSVGLNPLRGIALIWNGQKTTYGFNNIVVVSVALIPAMEIKGGYNFEAKTFCGGVEFLWKNFHVSYTLNHHTFLGSTHRFALSVSFKDRSFESVYDSKSKLLPPKPVNINTCTLNDLLTIPLLNETIARRIILYRKKIGPITLKSLSQIGMESQDIKALMKYIYGLKKIKKKFNKKYKRYKSNKKPGLFTHRDKKRLFHSLIKSGVPALKAAKISYARYKRNYRELRRLIAAIKNRNVQKKALRLCLK